MDRLSYALCSTPPSARSAIPATHALPTPRCYFYGPQGHAHPLCETLTRQLDATRADLIAAQPTICTATPDQATATNAAATAHESERQRLVPSGSSQAMSSAANVPGPAGQVLVLSSSNMLEGGTGCHVWPAGLWLAQWLLNNPHIVKGKRCLELGAGTGLVGAVAAQLGASQVHSPPPPPARFAPIRHHALICRVCTHTSAESSISLPEASTMHSFTMSQY